LNKTITNIKKKLLPLLLISAVISAMLPGMTVMAAASVWDGTSASASLSGSGTSADPYQINSAADLAHMVNDRSSSGKYYSLNTDIDLNGHQWTPIDVFYGKLNGNNHTISGLAIGTADTPSSGAELGFIRHTEVNAVIRNLNLSNIAIYSNGGSYIGGIISNGTNSTITNCNVDGIISIASGGTRYYYGGVIGFASGSISISGCNSSCDITYTGSGEYEIGGIVGWMQSGCSVDNCSSDGTLTGPETNTTAPSRIGGLVGYMTGTAISNSHSGSMVAGNKTATMGGLVGYVVNGTGAVQSAGEVIRKAVPVPQPPHFFLKKRGGFLFADKKQDRHFISSEDIEFSILYNGQNGIILTNDSHILAIPKVYFSIKL